METITMSRKEIPRPGLVAAALAGRITNREGAAALHLTARQFQRLKQRFRLGGAAGLCHQSRGQPSRRRLPAGLCAQVQGLLHERYAGFNDTHLTEKLREVHGLVVSRESVRRLRRALGLPAVHRRRPARHRARRPRAPAAGQLVQLDGSPFEWLEGRGPALTLLGAIDDATSQVLALHFRPTEDLHGYARLLEQVFTTVGLPVALYGDGVNILVRTDSHWSLEEQLAGAQAPTHLGRVLGELGIGYVQARSPQGKGRVERLWGTLQDRLVSELRVRGIATPAAANAFLPVFLADFNRRFARPASAPAVWRRPPRDLDLLLSCRYQRIVARDNTVRLGPRLIQIPPGPARRSYARRRVEVRELLDGRVVVLAAGRVIARSAAPGGEFTLAPRRAPGADRRPRHQPRALAAPLQAALAALAAALKPLAPRPTRSRLPAPGHPWRVAFKLANPRSHPIRG
jgi:transposase